MTDLREHATAPAGAPVSLARARPEAPVRVG
jgi:hypothetical protein